MAETLSNLIYADIQVTANIGDPLQSAIAQTPPQPPLSLAYGSGAQQAQSTSSTSWNVPAAGNRVISMNGLSPQPRPLNTRIVTFNYVNALLFSVTGNGPVTLFNNGTNPFNGPMGGATPTLTLSAGEGFMAWAPGTGWSTASATRSLLIDNPGASIATYDMYVLGT